MKALLGMPYPVGTILGAIAACMLLVGCDTATTITPRPTPTQVSRVVPTPTLPVLGPEKGWHTVLTLGNTDGQQSIFGGSFVATKQYSISFTCEGDGMMSLAFAQAKQTVPCSFGAQPNGILNQEPSAPGQIITITVTTQGPVVWEALVEMRD